ncbi:hypothetical protein SAMN05428949_6596 [Chitinophaga sp. YR627]|nr:hypothetical protein SAMN05428949_6596 [Chitinophaga sp. YR627]
MLNNLCNPISFVYEKMHDLVHGHDPGDPRRFL